MGENFLDEAAAYPERPDRPDVLEGARPGRHARRRDDRAARAARADPAGHAAVQPQRRRRAGAARRADDREFRPWYVGQATSRSELLYAALDRAGLRYWKSAANFVLVDGGARARELVDGLIARGVLVRDRSKDPSAPTASASRPASSNTRSGRRRRWRRCAEGGNRSADGGNADPPRPESRRHGPLRQSHRHPLSRSHARSGRAAWRLRSRREAHGRPRRRSASHGRRRRHRARRSRAQALGNRARHQSRRLLRDADGRDAGRGRHRSRRPAAHGRRHEGQRAASSAICRPSSCTTSSRASRWARAPTSTSRCCTAARIITRSKRASRRSPARCAWPARRTSGWRRCCRARRACCDRAGRLRRRQSDVGAQGAATLGAEVRTPRTPAISAARRHHRPRRRPLRCDAALDDAGARAIRARVDAACRCSGSASACSGCSKAATKRPACRARDVRRAAASGSTHACKQRRRPRIEGAARRLEQPGDPWRSRFMARRDRGRAGVLHAFVCRAGRSPTRRRSRLWRAVSRRRRARPRLPACSSIPEKSGDVGLRSQQLLDADDWARDAVQAHHRVPRRARRQGRQGRQLRGAARRRRSRRARGRYNREGIDEIVILDVTATLESAPGAGAHDPRRRAEIFLPLCVGGGIRTEDDAAAAIEAGADKVSLNTAALAIPALITTLAARYGSQAVIVAIDAKRATAASRSTPGAAASDDPRRRRMGARGRRPRRRRDPADLDRSRRHARGFDCEMTAAVSDAVPIPVIASGGAGTFDHFADVFTAGHADAALAASIFHFNEKSVGELKAFLAAADSRASVTNAEESRRLGVACRSLLINIVPCFRVSVLPCEPFDQHADSLDRSPERPDRSARPRRKARHRVERFRRLDRRFSKFPKSSSSISTPRCARHQRRLVRQIAATAALSCRRRRASVRRAEDLLAAGARRSSSDRACSADRPTAISRR